MESSGPYFVILSSNTSTEGMAGGAVLMKCSNGNPVIAFRDRQLGENWLPKMKMDQDCYLSTIVETSKETADSIRNTPVLLFDSELQIHKYLKDREAYSQSVELFSYEEVCNVSKDT